MNGAEPERPPIIISQRSAVSVAIFLGAVATAVTLTYFAAKLEGRVISLEQEVDRMQERGGDCGFTQSLIMLAFGRLGESGDFTREGRPRVAAVRRELSRLGLRAQPGPGEIASAWAALPEQARLTFRRRAAGPAGRRRERARRSRRAARSAADHQGSGLGAGRSVGRHRDSARLLGTYRG